MCNDSFCRCSIAKVHTADLSSRRNSAATAESDVECLMFHIVNIKKDISSVIKFQQEKIANIRWPFTKNQPEEQQINHGDVTVKTVITNASA